MRKVPISRKWGIHVEEVRYHFGASLVLSIISDKWKPSIICKLDEGARFASWMKGRAVTTNCTSNSTNIMPTPLAKRS